MLASSAKPDEVDHYLDLLDARDARRRLDDLGRRRARPSPSRTSCSRRVEKAGGGDAVMVGDSTWDCEAAKRAGIKSIGVLTGGFSDQELLRSGRFEASIESIVELRRRPAIPLR